MASSTFTPANAKADPDWHKVICECGRSVVLPNHPAVHCPKCHDTFDTKLRVWPARCAHCNFNLRKWRNKNGIPQILLATA